MKNSKTKFSVKVPSVTAIDFVMITPFAKYRIPRSRFVTFSKATDVELQNVIGYLSHTYQFDKEGSFIPSFYWYDLDDIFDADQFEQFKETVAE
jgi:hypothetical protein